MAKETARTKGDPEQDQMLNNVAFRLFALSIAQAKESPPIRADPEIEEPESEDE